LAGAGSDKSIQPMEEEMIPHAGKEQSFEGSGSPLNFFQEQELRDIRLWVQGTSQALKTDSGRRFPITWSVTSTTSHLSFCTDLLTFSLSFQGRFLSLDEFLSAG